MPTSIKVSKEKKKDNGRNPTQSHLRTHSSVQNLIAGQKKHDNRLKGRLTKLRYSAQLN